MENISLSIEEPATIISEPIKEEIINNSPSSDNKLKKNRNTRTIATNSMQDKASQEEAAEAAIAEAAEAAIAAIAAEEAKAAIAAAIAEAKAAEEAEEAEEAAEKAEAAEEAAEKAEAAEAAEEAEEVKNSFEGIDFENFCVKPNNTKKPSQPILRQRQVHPNYMYKMMYIGRENMLHPRIMRNVPRISIQKNTPKNINLFMRHYQ